jgi:hypothetical protein
MKTKNINTMKTLLLTIAMLGFNAISFATNDKSFNPENIEAKDQSLKIEAWMMQTDYFSTEDTLDMEDVANINLEEETENKLEIEDWMMKDFSESSNIHSNEKALKIEDWMLKPINEVKKQKLKLESWMF